MCGICQQAIHMKYQALYGFFKKEKICMLQILGGMLCAKQLKHNHK